jgi:hypothetical protein
MNRMAEEEQVMQCFNELVYHEPFSFDLKWVLRESLICLCCHNTDLRVFYGVTLARHIHAAFLYYYYYYYYYYIIPEWVWDRLVLWPLFGLSCSPRWYIIIIIVEQLVECQLAGETEVLGENLPQCHSAHHKSHMTWPGLEPEPPRWETGD